MSFLIIISEGDKNMTLLTINVTEERPEKITVKVMDKSTSVS